MQTPDEIIDEGFRELDLRMARLRLTSTEAVAMAETSYPTYWRCKPRSDGKHTHANINSRKKCLAAIERALDEYELRIAQENYEAKIA